MFNPKKMWPALLVTGMLLIATGCATSDGGTSLKEEVSAPEPELAITLADPYERVSSGSAASWVAVADAVVTARLIDEARPKTNESDPEWDGMTPRTGVLEIVDVLWTSPEPKNKLAADETIKLNLTGWVTQSERGEMRFGMAGQSRIEVGHQYVIALAWLEPECDPDDGNRPGEWGAIGSGGIIPADDNILGNSEFEGKAITPNAPKNLGNSSTSIQTGKKSHCSRSTREENRQNSSKI